MMKQILLLAFISCTAISVNAQNLRGQWRGSFDEKTMGFSDQTEYVLELDIKGDKLSGYSYTYFNIQGKRYYTICKLEGTYDKLSKSIVSKEVERVKANTPPGFKDCFQTHTLTYFKRGETEELVGTWKPANPTDQCGSGDTKLERQLLVRNKILSDNRNNITKNSPPKNNSSSATSRPKVISPDKSTAQSTPDNTKTNVAPPLVKLDEPKVTADDDRAAPPSLSKDPIESKIEPRRNNVLQTIDVKKLDLTVELYDNAEIDGDTVTVIFNGQVVASHKGLSDKPIVINLKIDPKKENILSMYANNLGKVPPNTAVMVVNTGDDYYKVFLTSDNNKNGTVVFRYKPG